MTWPRVPRWARALAGPVLIIGSVLVILHLFAFSGRVSNQNADVLSLWLPTHCYLGRTLAAGHVPAWNPYAMGGAPFAADPQSGWMYAPSMLLYTALPCGTALRWFIVLQPILAGLGLYWFCRSEGLSRAAATMGGVAIGAGLAGSSVVLALPFSATFAWTSLTLAAASRLLRARDWARRLVWVAVTALAWGQLAAAHFSTGFVLGSVAIVAYIAGRIVEAVRSGDARLGHLLGVAAILVVAVPLVNLAWLWPRLAYVPRTNLALGYDRLEVLARAYAHGLPAVSPLPGRAVRLTEPLRHVASPGQYLGASALALTFAGWRTRHRAVVVAFAVFGVLCYVLSLQSVADWGATHFRQVRVLGVWLREPARFAFGIPIAVAALAAFGVDGWRTAASRKERVVLIAPAVAVWVCLPLAFGADLGYLGLFLGATLATAAVLVATSFRPSLVWLFPVLLAGELMANGLAAQEQSTRPLADTPANQVALRPLYQLARPDVWVNDVLRPGPIARVLRHAKGRRFLSIDPDGWDPRGLHVHQSPSWWPLLAMNQSMPFHLQAAHGYDATQVRRYWEFIRAVDPRQVKYNDADFERPAPVALDLLDVDWIVTSTEARPPAERATPVVREGPWTLYRIVSRPRAQVMPFAVGVSSAQQALRGVLSPRFDPTRTVLIERTGPTFSAGVLAGTATFRRQGPASATIHVSTSRMSTVLIRNVFDPNWRAKLDGRRVPLLHADYLLQAIVVPKGRHTIVLSYDDPTIWAGLVGSAAALLALFGLALFLPLQRRRRAMGESVAHGNHGRRRGEAR